MMCQSSHAFLVLPWTRLWSYGHLMLNLVYGWNRFVLIMLQTSCNMHAVEKLYFSNTVDLCVHNGKMI